MAIAAEAEGHGRVDASRSGPRRSLREPVKICGSCPRCAARAEMNVLTATTEDYSPVQGIFGIESLHTLTAATPTHNFHTNFPNVVPPHVTTQTLAPSQVTPTGSVPTANVPTCLCLS